MDEENSYGNKIHKVSHFIRTIVEVDSRNYYVGYVEDEKKYFEDCNDRCIIECGALGSKTISRSAMLLYCQNDSRSAQHSFRGRGRSLGRPLVNVRKVLGREDEFMSLFSAATTMVQVRRGGVR